MDEQATPFEALKAAVNRAGSQSAFARICGVSQPSVWKWLQSGKRLPAEHVLKVEAQTGVSRFDLRPDVYPSESSHVPAAAPTRSPAVGDGGSTVSCDRPAILQRGARA
jgi:DNA-binding transcriptional regulator YdaS (Cro superfamily)